MKIKVGHGEGLNKQKTYHSFILQIIIFSYIHTVITGSKLNYLKGIYCSQSTYENITGIHT